jgi:hypothetical protein
MLIAVAADGSAPGLATRTTGPRIRRMHGTTNERTISVSSSSPTHEFAKCVAFQRGTSRYVFTTDVSVNEVQAFIRDLVLVMGRFTLLDRYGR